MKRKSKPVIIALRPHYTTFPFSSNAVETVEQVFDGDTFVGALITPRAGGRIKFLTGSAGDRYLLKIQDATYAALNRHFEMKQRQ